MSDSTAYLVALLVASFVLAILLGLLWWTQARRWEAMRRAVKAADLDSLAADLSEDSLYELFARVDYSSSRLLELLVGPPPWTVSDPRVSVREDLQQATFTRRELQKQISNYRQRGRKVMLLPVEGLDGPDELAVVQYLGALQRLRRADRHLIELMGAIEQRFGGRSNDRE